MSWSCGFQIRVRSGPSRGITHVIDTPVLKIGRAIRPGERVEGWIRLSDDTVSRLHCELFWQEDRSNFRLLHRSTTNSTYVNGEVVEDAELFEGDIIEIGSTNLEVQKADLRWSKTQKTTVDEWATPVEKPEPKGQASLDIPNEVPSGMRQIPGATIPSAPPPLEKTLSIGPTLKHFLVTKQGEPFPLEGSRARFGGSTPPPSPEGDETNQAPKLSFDSEYIFEHQQFSYYNLVLIFDELSSRFKIAKIGPDARDVMVSRLEDGILWEADLPEGKQLLLLEGDTISMGALKLNYKTSAKEEDTTDS